MQHSIIHKPVGRSRKAHPNLNRVRRAENQIKEQRRVGVEYQDPKVSHISTDTRNDKRVESNVYQEER